MKKIVAFSTIAVAILAGSAFLGTAEQAAAKDYEFCRQDIRRVRYLAASTPWSSASP